MSTDTALTVPTRFVEARGIRFAYRRWGKPGGPVSTKAAATQLHAIREWGAVPSSDRYATLPKIKHPTLVVHGTRDIVVQPVNAFILAEHLPDAQLILYPDSSHGAQYQHAELFLKHAKLFLSA